MIKTLPEVRLVSWDYYSVKLTIDGVEYRYETSYYIVQKFRQFYRRSPLRALNHLKKNNYKWERTGRVIDWK